jgi:F0F1-type ATP synthase membrane subunit b/b'
MTNSVKERIQEDLQKAKSEGSLRAERIRDIVKAAVSEAMAEVSQGTGELKAIATDALTAAFAVVRDRAATRTEDMAASVEGVVEGIGESHRGAIAQAQVQIDDLQQTLNQADRQLEAEITTALATVDLPEAEATTKTPFKVLVDLVVNTVKEREVFNIFQQRYDHLKQQLAELDTRLQERYGDRYDEVKRQLETAQAWYASAKAEGETLGTEAKHFKQDELEAKAADLGTTIAQKEAKIKAQLREIVNNALR